MCGQFCKRKAWFPLVVRIGDFLLLEYVNVRLPFAKIYNSLNHIGQKKLSPILTTSVNQT